VPKHWRAAKQESAVKLKRVCGAIHDAYARGDR